MKLVAMLLTIAALVGIVNGQPTQSSMRREIPELPFRPEDSKIVGSVRDGDVETITYEYQGKKYQEVRVHSQPRIVPDPHQNSINLLVDRLGLSQEQAFQVAMTLGNFDWKKYRHLDEKWPPSVVEKMRKQVASRVKNDIARIIGSKEPSELRKVLKLELGFEVVPLGDYAVRDDCRNEPPAKE